MLKKWILIFSLVLSLGLVWAQVNIIPIRTDVSGFADWTDTSVVGTTYLQLLVADANTISPAMDFTNFSAETLDFKARTYGGTNTVENEVTVSISTDNGSNWTVLGTRLPLSNSLVNMTQFDLSAYNGTQVKIKFSVAGTSNTVGAGIDDISIKGVASSPLPTLVINPDTLNGFSYLEGNGPSAAQSFAVSGSNLDGNVSLTAPTNYQISLSSGTGFAGTLSINHVGGTVAATTVYVILNAGLSTGLYNGETVNITAGTANPVSVTLNGSVTAELPEDGYLVNFDGEGETKTGYATGTVSLNGIDWDLTQALIGDSTSDFFNGVRSARLNGKATSSMTMLADKTGGLGTLSFPYRRYGTDAQVAWKAEYSIDAGTSWTQIGSEFTATADVQTFSQVVNVAGNVRIKISLVTDTGSSNKRINIDDIMLGDYAGGSTPTIYASGTFTEFSTFTGIPSESQSYSLSGASLSANINITAPTGFQVSVDDVTFAGTASVLSTFSGLIYVRLSGASVGSFSGNIAHTSTGASAVNLPVAGTVTAPTPTITITGTLNSFNTAPGTPSGAQNYTVEGIFLSGNLSITAPAGFEVSLSAGAGYAGLLQLTPTSGTVASTTIYARLTGATAGSFSGDISHVSTGAVTQNLAVSGTVAVAVDPLASILLRPAQISILDATHESAVLVQVENYPSDDARYRLYNGSNQYNPWDAATGAWIVSSSYSSGPQVPGTPSSSVSWWIPFQRGNNATTVASYRDRLAPYSSNYKTAVLPAATAITTPVPIVQSQVTFSTWSDYSVKHIVLAYDATSTLIAAASTEIGTGAFTVLVETGTTITRIEVRDVMNNLLDTATGSWPQTLNPQIILSGEIDPLFNVAGNPSEELGMYTVQGVDLTADISVVAPEHFELATDSEGPWSGSISLSPAYNGTVYVRINSAVVGEHSGDITHSSTGATNATIQVTGETLAPDGTWNIVNNMTLFIQETGTPSPAQSYNLGGTGMSGNTAIVTSAPFELSLNGTGGWATELSVAASFNAMIYVRLNSPTMGEFIDVEITHTNANALPSTILVSGVATVPAGPVDNIFFSEYIEGGSNNKALEIYNASGAPVDLSRYKVELYTNGSTTVVYNLDLVGTLAAGDVYVIANSGSVPAVLDLADATSTVTYYNGDDALVLRCLNPDTIIDVFGIVGVDPGTAWDVAGEVNATQNHTLVRKATVENGSTDRPAQQGTDAASSQWIVLPQDTFSDLGTHYYNPGAQIASAPVFDPPTGTYTSAISVSLSTATAGATMRYTTDGTDPTISLGTVYSAPIPVSQTTTIKAIAYAPNYDPSMVNSATYTIILPTPVSNIAALRSMPTGSENVYTLTGEAVLTYQNANRNTKYIQDATAAILIDDYAGNITTVYNLYDGITGITGTLNVYNSLLQFVPIANPGAATSTNNVIVPEVRTLLSLTEADQAKLIKVMDVTISHATYTDFPATAQNLTATDATAALTLRTFVETDYANTPIPSAPVNLTCLVGQFGATMQVSPRFLSDIATTGGALATPMVQIALSGTDVELTWAAINGANSYRIEAANDPYGTFTVETTTANLSYSVAASAAKKFYRVVALP